jgi:hypothetical protein
MPKMTKKFSGALDAAEQAFIGFNRKQETDQEALYRRLQEIGFFWDSQSKKWEEYDVTEADEPSPLIMVRVWADEEIIQEAADDIVSKSKKIWQLIERSEPYRCRPPKQREARIYLRFLPKGVNNAR